MTQIRGFMRMTRITLIIFVIMLTVLAPFFVWAQMPNDPEARQWAYEHVGLYKAWDFTIGSRDIVVAVVDNGIDFLHPDLEDNMWKNNDEISGNGIDDDKNGYIDDVWGWNFADNNNDPRPNVEALSDVDREEYTFSHGTLVAGLIGAVGNNGLDGTGVNWHTQIMSVKILDNSGEGDIVPLSPAIRYAVDNGADVINISAVGYENGDKDDIKQAVKYAYENGVAVVAAAGNGNTYLNASPLYPICADFGTGGQMVLGVSAVTPDHHLTRFSNTGSDCIDITAPGIDVSSTVRFSPTNGLKERYKGGWSGTSFAAPLVSGAAALLKGLQPNWGAKEIYIALLSTVHHTGGQDETVYADLFGKGLLQIDKAVKYAVDNIKSARPIKKIVFANKKEIKNLLTGGEKILFSAAKEIKGDFDHDGRDESAVFEDKLEPGLITIRDHGGEVMFRFFIFDNLKAGSKIELLAGDYNGDNVDELIAVAPGRKIKIWSLFPLRGLEELALNNVKKRGVTLIGY